MSSDVVLCNLRFLTGDISVCNPAWDRARKTREEEVTVVLLKLNTEPAHELFVDANNVYALCLDSDDEDNLQLCCASPQRLKSPQEQGGFLPVLMGLGSL